MQSGAFLVFVDVSAFREEKAEKRLALKPASLRDTEQTQIVAGAFLAERPGDLSLDGKMAKRSFRCVIVPRHSVILKE